MTQSLPRAAGTHAPTAIRLLRAPGMPARATPPANQAIPIAPGASPKPAVRPAASAPATAAHGVAMSPKATPGVLAATSKSALAAFPRRRPTGAATWSWMRMHKAATATVALMVIAASGVLATVLIRQDIATTSSAVAPEVTFLTGTDYTSITNTGFAVLTIGTSGASATLSTLKGIPGAATVDLTNLLRIQGAPTGTKDYSSSTLSTDVAIPTAISHLYVTVKHGATTDLNAWDAKSGVASSTFTITHAVTYDVSVSIVVADGTAAGSLSPAFNLQLNLVP